MLCSIIPYSRSIDDGLLTYSVPEEFRPFVKVGSSVHISWGKETILGIVANMGQDLPFEGELKPITGPHCTVPWLSPSEISLVLHLARTLFVRIHTVAQLFLPVGVFGLFEKDNFLSLIAPVSSKKHGGSEYLIAPDEDAIKGYLRDTLSSKPGAVILPEGISVKSWSSVFDQCTTDHHPKSITSQKKIYLDILSVKNSVLFGTRRTLTKRLGGYSDIYIIYDNISTDIVFGQRHIPLWLMAQMLEEHGHTIHYLTTTPSVRTLCDFLQNKKSVQYL